MTEIQDTLKVMKPTVTALCLCSNSTSRKILL